MINMLKIGKTIVLSFNSYAIRLRQLMGVSPGDKVYALKRGMYFSHMTQEQYDSLLAKYDAKIEAASADYQELARLLEEKEAAELLLMDLMEQWDAAQG